MTLSAILLRFEEPFAVLGNEALGEFRWPRTNLPENLAIGDLIHLQVAQPGAENNGGAVDEEKQYERMRRLLEELIN